VKTGIQRREALPANQPLQRGIRVSRAMDMAHWIPDQVGNDEEDEAIRVHDNGRHPGENRGPLA
jgi:hypothetical protein